MLDTSPKFLCDIFIYKHYLLVQTGTTDNNFICSAVHAQSGKYSKALSIIINIYTGLDRKVAN